MAGFMRNGALHEDEASSAAAVGIARSVFWATTQAGGPGRMSDTVLIVAAEEDSGGR